MIEEEWRTIKGYEGLYAVSSLGRVKSLGNDKSRKEKILRPGKAEKGYLFVGLCRNGKPKWYKVHRLVLSTFNPIENMENLEVNHLDENKLNNNLSNLEWTTHENNINHGTRTLRAAEKNSIPIAQLTLDGKLVKAWKSSMDAEREGGFYTSGINACCKNKYSREGNNIYKGYKWQYLSEYIHNIDLRIKKVILFNKEYEF